jgi:hypothetical protein
MRRASQGSVAGHICPCTAGRFWEDARMVEAMSDKMRQIASKLSVMRVTDYFLSELDRIGSA